MKEEGSEILLVLSSKPGGFEVFKKAVSKKAVSKKAVSKKETRKQWSQIGVK
jgi:hypothetical protein